MSSAYARMRWILTLLAMMGMPLSVGAFEPTMSLTVEMPLTPVFHGVTNLPDDANLMLSLTRPDVLYAAQSKMVVKGGKFQSERLSYRGKPLTPGRYKIEISMAAAAFNPPNVQAVIGARGEKMTGQWVTRGAIDEKEFLYTALVDLGGAANTATDVAARTERNVHLEIAVIQNCKQTVIEMGAVSGTPHRGEAYRDKVRACIRTAASSDPAAAELIVERFDNSR